MEDAVSPVGLVDESIQGWLVSHPEKVVGKNIRAIVGSVLLMLRGLCLRRQGWRTPVKWQKDTRTPQRETYSTSIVRRYTAVVIFILPILLTLPRFLLCSLHWQGS